MKKILLSFCIVLFIVGCAKKELSNNESNIVTQEETIQPNVTEAPEVESQEEKKPFEDGGVVGSIYFDFDKFDIRQDMQEVIDQSIGVIEANPEMKILIEGNTDEFGSGEYNFALGNKRALAVKVALVTRGIDKNKISVVSLGKTNPICIEKTNECYQKNRRGDIRLVK